MIEHRSITCLACRNLDLKERPAEAREGFGRCTIDPPYVFVRIQQSRNCKSYEAAAEDQVKAREQWSSKIKLPAWQR